MSNISLKLDRQRTLTYRWSGLRTITQRLNNCTMIEFLNKLGQTQPDTLHAALFVGLTSDDEKLTGQRLDELIQGYIDGGGQLTTLVNAVLEAMQEDGLLYKEKKAEGSEPANPMRS